MNRSFYTIIFILFSISISIPYRVEADTPPSLNYPSPEYASLKPSLAVVIGILTIMFVLTFLLVAYAKFCHTPSEAQHVTNPNDPGAILTSANNNRFSGIDKTVIESLPFFRFSSLKGSKQGLECSVCLSRFEDVEVLRLLPKCKHAFHIDCIDRWLEKHSSCPLCRHKVSSEDLKLVSYSDYSNSIRQDSLFVQREESHNYNNNSNRGSSRFSFRKIVVDADDESNNLIVENESGSDFFHKHNHKILVSEFVFKNRWSNVTSSDLIHLNSEMTKKKVKEFEDKVGTNSGSNNNKASLNPGEQRSASEITSYSRYGHLSEESDRNEERVRRVWLPIARKTVQWFVNREDHSSQAIINQQTHHRQSLNV